MKHTTTVQHTPGKWRIGDAGHTVFGPPNGNPCPEIIATLGRNFRGNGALIAANPDMEEALQFYSTGKQDNGIFARKVLALIDVGHNASGAIAKAEGSQ